jgi:hypothetical protein
VARLADRRRLDRLLAAVTAMRRRKRLDHQAQASLGRRRRHRAAEAACREGSGVEWPPLAPPSPGGGLPRGLRRRLAPIAAGWTATSSVPVLCQIPSSATVRVVRRRGSSGSGSRRVAAVRGRQTAAMLEPPRPGPASPGAESGRLPGTRGPARAQGGQGGRPGEPRAALSAPRDPARARRRSALDAHRVQETPSMTTQRARHASPTAIDATS